jgi:hypothetical protein
VVSRGGGESAGVSVECGGLRAVGDGGARGSSGGPGEGGWSRGWAELGLGGPGCQRPSFLLGSPFFLVSRKDAETPRVCSGDAFPSSWGHEQSGNEKSKVREQLTTRTVPAPQISAPSRLFVAKLHAVGVLEAMRRSFRTRSMGPSGSPGFAPRAGMRSPFGAVGSGALVAGVHAVGVLEAMRRSFRTRSVGPSGSPGFAPRAGMRSPFGAVGGSAGGRGSRRGRARSDAAFLQNAVRGAFRFPGVRTPGWNA